MASPSPARLGLIVILSSSACLPGLGKPPAPPPRTQATALREPSSLLPRDLDVVVRIDIAKIRSTLGEATAKRLADEGMAKGDGELSTLLATKASAVWIGFRGGWVDSVLVAKGEPAELDPEAWLPAASAGGPSRFQRRPATEPGLVWFDRRERAGRTQPSMLVWLAAGVLGAISPAEVDSVERVIRQGGDADRLRPREDAVLSFAVRGRALSREIAKQVPVLADILTKSTSADGSVDLVGGEVRAEGAFGFESSAEADRALAELERLVLDLRRDKGLRVATLARGIGVTRGAADTVNVRILLAGDAVRVVLGAGATGGAASPIEHDRRGDAERKQGGQR